MSEKKEIFGVFDFVARVNLYMTLIMQKLAR